MPHRIPLLVFVAALALVGAVARPAVADRRHDVQHQLQQARERAAAAGRQAGELNSAIAATSDRIDAVEAQIGAESARVSALEVQLSRAQARLGALTAALREKTRELARARGQLHIGERQLAQRLVQLYTAPGADAVSVVVGATDLQELIDAVETRERVAAYDKSIVDQVSAARTRFAKERARTAALERQQTIQTAHVAARTSERRRVLASLVVSRRKLVALRDSRERSLSAISVERNQWEAEANALQAESQRLATLAAAPPPPPRAAPSEQQPGAPPPPSSSTGFIWPVQGTVVSPYGMRWGRLHAGIDIAAPGGTAIAASASGRVSYSGWMSGYGNIVVIDHGGGLATAYGHNSSNAVGVGQTVAQGQTIAYVGCTGHCFGNHVHFEIRVNGSPVDPMGYL